MHRAVAAHPIKRSILRCVTTAAPFSRSTHALVALAGNQPPRRTVQRIHTAAAAHSRSMSTNAHDVDPGSKKVDANGSAPIAAAGAGVADSAAAASAGTVARLAQGDRTRFLSRSYTIPFPPLQQQLSFDDKSTWPKDPMQVFSQWYADAEFEYNKRSPDRMDAPIHWPNTMQIATLSPSGFPSVRTVLLKGFDPRGLIFFTNYQGSKGSALLQDPRTALVFYSKTNERQMRVEGLAEKLSDAESDAYFHERPIQSQIGGVVSPQSRPIANHAALERSYVDTVLGVAQEVARHLEKQSKRVKNDSSEESAEEAREIAETKAKVAQMLNGLSAQSGAAEAGTDQSAASSSSAAAAAALPVVPTSAADLAATHNALQLALASLQSLEDTSEATRSLLRRIVHRPPHWGGFLIRPQQMEFWCDGAYRLHSRIVYTKANKNNANNKGTTAESEWNTTYLGP